MKVKEKEKEKATHISHSSTNKEKEPIKPCCACPKTKEARDHCIIEKGTENCAHLIQAHKECMKKLGFNI